MKQLLFKYKETCEISYNDLVNESLPISDEIKRMNKATQAGYEDMRASINLPFDRKNLDKVNELAKKYKNIDYVIVVGIGGSNLGTMAVVEAVKGRFHNYTTNKTKILFADTVDPDSLSSIAELMKSSLKKRKKVLLCFITKSGGTTETIANFEFLFTILKKQNKKAEDFVVAITDADSKLHGFAQNKKFKILTIPKRVGGRYSVFSAVGLFPLAVVGVDIEQLLIGAQSMAKACLNTSILENPAAVSATLLLIHFDKKKNINDNFFFSTDMESVGKWYRQLMGESIGKKHDIHSRIINAGITPTVSIGSTDLHSMAQLYLGGPYDKYTTFITINNHNNNIKVPNMKEYDALVPNIQGREISEIMDAIIDGVKAAFKKGNRPYAEIILPDKSEFAIGQLLQFKMMEMMYLGSLLMVNPFDQPSVEEYKTETKNILGLKR